MNAPLSAQSQSPRRLLIEDIRAHPARLCRAVGRPVHWEPERTHDPARVDHVWITLDIAGGIGLVRASVSTHSYRNEAAGYDGRVRIGVAVAPDTRVPGEEFVFSDGLDYGRLERTLGATYEMLERANAEALLLSKAAEASLIEIWGRPYIQRHLGIHNIHSMRRSCAVADDRVGSDGGLRLFYPDEKPAEFLLLKFCGQP